ncbi:hypothetical protein KQX54_015305 [Cotesia glomerata]|uniref:Uncharacterized protein n=1 Tax=Cotesia glomerata TaxID=32391 RepID=A0AAV7IV95_COTGL|nr:hypothetical protein KQX54_015305 [Cotesia glomerata]
MFNYSRFKNSGIKKREKPGQCIVFYSRSVVTDVTVLAAADRLIAVKLDVRQLTSDLVGKFMAHEGTRANDLRYTTYYITWYTVTAAVAIMCAAIDPRAVMSISSYRGVIISVENGLEKSVRARIPDTGVADAPKGGKRERGD